MNGSQSWVMWALLSAVFAALTAILAKTGIAGVNSHLATAIRTTVVLVFTWLLVFVAVGRVSFAALTSRNWIFLVLSGLATGLSWICYFRALQLGEASKVAPVDKLSVALTILLAAIFLGERLGWREIVGGGLIVIGVLLIAWRPV